MSDTFSWRYLPPNLVTSASIILACIAIILAVEGRLELAAWLLIWCALLDRVDGIVARLVKGSSPFGAQFDSLSDMVAFCLTPALLVYLCLSNPRYSAIYSDNTQHTILTIGVIFYLLAGTVRLARYNLQAAELGSRWFRGLPTTIAGALVGAYLLTVWELELPLVFIQAVPFILIALGLLMVCNWWLPKSFGRAKGIFALQILCGVVIYAFGFLMMYPQVLLACAVAYPLIGFTLGGPLRRGEQDLPPAAAATS